MDLTISNERNIFKDVTVWEKFTIQNLVREKQITNYNGDPYRQY